VVTGFVGNAVVALAAIGAWFHPADPSLITRIWGWQRPRRRALKAWVSPARMFLARVNNTGETQVKTFAVFALLAMPGTSSANFFFTLSDTIQVGCLETEVKTEAEAIRAIEGSTTMTCTAATDVEGSILLSCKGLNSTIFFFAKDKETCEKTLTSMRRLIGQ